MKRCTSCNQLLDNDSRFCSNCGGQMLEDVIFQEGTISKKKTNNGAINGRRETIAVTLCVLMSIIAILASLMFLLRASVSEEAVQSAMNKAFDDFADIPIGSLVDEEEDTTISEFVYSMLEEKYQSQIGKKNLRKLLNEEFVQDFVAEKMNDYLSDALYDNGRGKIKIDEIMELLEDNGEKIQKLTGFPMSEYNLDYIQNVIEDSRILKKTKLSTYAKDYESEFSVLRFFFSDAVSILLVVLGILLLAGIFFVLPDKTKACYYVGIAFIVVGCMNLFMVVISFSLPGMANDVLALGRKVYEQIFAPMRLRSVIQAVVVTAVGVGCMLFAKYSKKNTNQ